MWVLVDGLLGSHILGAFLVCLLMPIILYS